MGRQRFAEHTRSIHGCIQCRQPIGGAVAGAEQSSAAAAQKCVFWVRTYTLGGCPADTRRRCGERATPPPGLWLCAEGSHPDSEHNKEGHPTGDACACVTRATCGYRTRDVSVKRGLKSLSPVAHAHRHGKSDRFSYGGGGMVGFDRG